MNIKNNYTDIITNNIGKIDNKRFDLYRIIFNITIN